MSSISTVIILKRASKVYHEGETIAGVAVVESNSDVRHEGLSLTMEGSVNLQLSTKNVGIFEAFSNSIKPINLINTCIELAPPGKIPVGVTEIPFELPLRARQAVSPGYPGLLETYHGVFVNIMYTLKCSMKRSFLNKPVNASCQFFVQYRQQEPAPVKPVRCEINPATIRAGGGGGGRAPMPQFQIYAEIDSTVCPLDKPLTGKIRVDECSVPIRSIELQLVRVETCGCTEGYSKDATEIQNIQIGEGDVCRSRDIPLYMVLPRLFTCPTTTTVNFKIEFELNIAVIFDDDYLSHELYHPNPYQQHCQLFTEQSKTPALLATQNNHFEAVTASHHVVSTQPDCVQAHPEPQSLKKKTLLNKSSVDTSTFSIEERLVTAVWVHERKHTKNSMSQIKHDFRQRFGRDPPAKNTLLVWERKLFSTGSVHDAPRPGRPVNRRARMEDVAASVRAAPALSLRARALSLRVPRTTLRTILRRDLPHAPRARETAHLAAAGKQQIKRNVKRKLQSQRELGAGAAARSGYT